MSRASSTGKLPSGENETGTKSSFENRSDPPSVYGAKILSLAAGGNFLAVAPIRFMGQPHCSAIALAMPK